MPQTPVKARLDHRKTCRRYDDVGHAHALTFSCFKRQPFLSRDRTREWMIQAIELARSKHELDLWAFVIMPEHVHLLILPTSPGYRISAILSTLKQSVAKRAVLYVRRNAPEFLPEMTDLQPAGKQAIRFWQRGGGYDRNLWTPRHVWETIDYIHANPIRRQLCGCPSDWPWSSASFYEGHSSGPVKIDVGSLPDDPRVRS